MTTDAEHHSDPFQLGRFVSAQEPIYAEALREIQAGEKETHWMWFVFPQVAGLGRSSTAQYYAIGSIDEARAYLAHPVLGPRLRECAATVLQVQGQSARDIFGDLDEVKLRASMTLFAMVTESAPAQLALADLPEVATIDCWLTPDERRDRSETWLNALVGRADKRVAKHPADSAVAIEPETIDQKANDP